MENNIGDIENNDLVSTSGNFGSNSDAEYVTHNELRACLGELDARVGKTMIEYQSNIKETMSDAIAEIRQDSAKIRQDSIDKQSILDGAISKFKYWVIASTAAIILAVLGGIDHMSDTQSGAYLTGYDNRASQERFVDGVQSSYEDKIKNQNEKIGEISDKINLLIELQTNENQP